MLKSLNIEGGLAAVKYSLAVCVLYSLAFILLQIRGRKTADGLVYESIASSHKYTSEHFCVRRDELLSRTISNDNRVKHWPTDPSLCRMDTCFNFTRCLHGFKVYVYPSPEDVIISKSYKNILDIVKASQYYTTNPDDACIYISGVDTLDRDLRSVNYIEGLQQKLESLPHWNNGVNHLIFNLYSGTRPDYSEKLDIDIGYAMLAKASISTYSFRAGFDISLPLFKNSIAVRTKKAKEGNLLSNMTSLHNRKYLMVFKGKRYLYGVGTKSRNMLYRIHNGVDIIMLTTCKHGDDWQKYADDRCNVDNQLYDRWDYVSLLRNSKFCLVPRGRRLGSYRFLEVMEYGCVPVLLSDNWVLPFSDIIDWKRAAIRVNESQVVQLPDRMRAVSRTSVLPLHRRVDHLWSKYFNSLESIVMTTLQIVRDRLLSSTGPDSLTMA